MTLAYSAACRSGRCLPCFPMCQRARSPGAPRPPSPPPFQTPRCSAHPRGTPAALCTAGPCGGGPTGGNCQGPLATRPGARAPACVGVRRLLRHKWIRVSPPLLHKSQLWLETHHQTTTRNDHAAALANSTCRASSGTTARQLLPGAVARGGSLCSSWCQSAGGQLLAARQLPYSDTPCRLAQKRTHTSLMYEALAGGSSTVRQRAATLLVEWLAKPDQQQVQCRG